MRNKQTFYISLAAMCLGQAAYAEVFSITTPSQNGVTVTTRLDTGLNRLDYSIDLTSVAYDYEQVTFSPAPLPAFDAIPLDVGALSSAGLTEWNFHQIAGSLDWQLELQYLAAPPPPKMNQVAINYLSGTPVTGNFVGQAGSANLEVTLRRPADGFPPGQDDHISLWAYTPELDSIPSVIVVRPIRGSTVSDLVWVQAYSADPASIKQISFYIRNTATGAIQPLGRDLSTPYVLRWDTLGVVNGAYRIFANAEDVFGNHKTASTIVTVSN